MKKNLPSLKSQKGQVILIVLLVLSVVLVVGLSVASRSVTDIKISQQTQESVRALWVAQAGLEKAMKANLGIGATTLGGVQYSVVKTDTSRSMEYVFQESVQADNPVTLWLADRDASGQILDPSANNFEKLKFFWGNPNTSANSDETPALEATLIYHKGGSFNIKRYVYDPYSSRSPATGFDNQTSTTGCTIGGKTFAFCSNQLEDTPNGGKSYLVRLRLIFSGSVLHLLGVSGDAIFPSQGSCFESTATVPESGVTRKLQQCQRWQITPGIFDFGLFSGTSIQ